MWVTGYVFIRTFFTSALDDGLLISFTQCVWTTGKNANTGSKLKTTDDSELGN